MWESSGQGSEEATPLGPVGGVETRCGAVKWRNAPRSRVVDKDREGHLRIEGSQPPARPHSPGFQRQEDKAP